MINAAPGDDPGRGPKPVPDRFGVVAYSSRIRVSRKAW
jgi:hypothetical protein